MKAMFMTKLRIATALLPLVAVSLGTAAMLSQAAANSDVTQKAPVLVALAPALERKPIDSADLLRKVQGTTWFVTKADDTEHTISLQLHPTTGQDGSGGIAGMGDAKARAIQLDRLKLQRIRNRNGKEENASGLVEEVSGIALQLPVAKEAEIVIDGRKGKLADLQTGMQVSFQMDGPTITGIDATTSGRAILKKIDVEKKTITVTSGGQEWTAPLASDAKIVIKDKQDIPFSDLKIGMRVDVQLATDADRIVVKAIQAHAE
jgi:hypothetical protein